jgi:excisionase family DNA binding protein
MIGFESKIEVPKIEPITPCVALRPREAAKALGVCERTLWGWTDRGLVPSVRIGKVILYPVDALQEWLKKQAQLALMKN